jgi:ActR/RegA family two-component response regulator
VTGPVEPPVLVLSADAAARRRLLAELAAAGRPVRSASSLAEAMKVLRDAPVARALVDPRPEWIAALREAAPLLAIESLSPRP